LRQTAHNSFWTAEPACACWEIAKLHLALHRAPKAAPRHIFSLPTNHWDHIQGIPFFAPLYAENNEFQFTSFSVEFLGRDSFEAGFEAQMAVPYFPVDMSAMSAKRKFKEVDGGDTFRIGDNEITTAWLNHPQGCLGFRIETSAGSVVYATDNEPGDAKAGQESAGIGGRRGYFHQRTHSTHRSNWRARGGVGDISSWLDGARVAKEWARRHWSVSS